MGEWVAKSFNTPFFPRFLPSLVAMAFIGIVAFNVFYLRESLIYSVIEIGMAVCFIAVQILVIRKTAWRVDITSEDIAGFYFPRHRVHLRWEEVGELKEEFGVSLLPGSSKPTLILQSKGDIREISISRYIPHHDELTRLIRERLRDYGGRSETT